MEDNSLVEQINRCLNDSSEDIQCNTDIKLKKMCAEYEELRVRNRQMWFGLWLCRFISVYYENKGKKPAQPIKLKSQKPKSSIESQTSNWQYLIISTTVLAIISYLLIRYLVDMNAIY